MKEFFKPTRTDKIISRTSIASLCIFSLTLLYVFVRFFNLPPFIPIFNQLPWGNDRIGPKIFIFLPLVSTIFIMSANLVLSSYIYTKSPLLSRIFSVTSLLTTFLILIFSFVIIGLVT